jgi:uncharacterized RDD family membrane protein YckC
MPAVTFHHGVRAALALFACASYALGAATTATTATTAATLPATTRAAVAQPSVRQLLAHGTGEYAGLPRQIWVATVDPARAGARPEQTVVRFREAAGDEWQASEPLQLRAVGLTNEGSRLVALFADGTHGYYSAPQAYTAGISLPGGAHPIALAGGRTLWALARCDPSLLTSQPTTAPTRLAPATTRALSTTRALLPAPTYPLVLFSMDQQWTPRESWPDDLPEPKLQPLSLAVVGDWPIVAVADAQGAIHIHRFGPEARRYAPVRPDQNVLDFKLLAGQDGVVLWLLTPTGGGELWAMDGTARLPLKHDRPPLHPGQVDIAFTGDFYRLFFLSKDQLLEQRYSTRDGQPDGLPVPVSRPRSALLDTQINWFYIIGLGVLMFLLMGTLRKQRSRPVARILPGGWEVAPLGTRILAAIIDAAPLIAAAVVIIPRVNEDNYRTLLIDDAVSRHWALIGSGVYLLHTMISEMLTARTLGKLICGLRVVALDGQAARSSAIFFRNVLRIMDLPLPAPMGLIVDAAIVLYSPLRQRLGDLAAATLVVRKTDKPVPPPPPPDEEESYDQDDEDESDRR